MAIMTLLLGCSSTGCIEEAANVAALAGYLAVLQDLLASLTAV